MGRNLGNPPFATRESLPLIRERELEEACKAIGITDLRKMGLRDKTVEFEPYDQMDQMIQSLIDETNPSLIISFYPKFAVHPDHEATAGCSTYSWAHACIRSPTSYTCSV